MHRIVGSLRQVIPRRECAAVFHRQSKTGLAIVCSPLPETVRCETFRTLRGAVNRFPEATIKQPPLDHACDQTVARREWHAVVAGHLIGLSASAASIEGRDGGKAFTIVPIRDCVRLVLEMVRATRW